jgi:2-C-methyl-D-erythritol 2,4-cyclodiphosphate synthase
MGQRDIGWHFPDSDPALAGCNSRDLLRRAVAWGADDGWQVVNADATIVAQQPRLTDYVPAMRACVAADLNIAEGAANIKATTTERMGFTGRREGIAAMAVVLISGD